MMMRSQRFVRRLAVVGGLIGAAWWLAPGSLVTSAQQPGATVTQPGGTFVAVLVEDLDAAVGWYRRVFDLAEVNRLDAEDGRFAIRILSGNGITVELITRADVEPSVGLSTGLFKVGFYGEDIEALHRRLRDLGLDVDEAVFTDDALGVRSFVFRDPEGNRLQAFESIAGRVGP